MTLSYVQVPWLVVLDQIDLLVMVTGLLTLTLTLAFISLSVQ